jgi:hypothetical protein
MSSVHCAPKPTLEELQGCEILLGAWPAYSGANIELLGPVERLHWCGYCSASKQKQSISDTGCLRGPQHREQSPMAGSQSTHRVSDWVDAPFGTSDRHCQGGSVVARTPRTIMHRVATRARSSKRTCGSTNYGLGLSSTVLTVC